MLVERWRRVESLFHEALAKSPAEWANFLDEACSGDTALRREIESLLVHESLAGGFLESDQSDTRPAAPRDPVPAGERMGPYTIVEPLGAGGMGEVYKAHDERLDRDVAIKFLLRRMAEDAASLERFEREARAASALNHPNICTVHDVGESQGRRYIVMELLDGQSLKERIARGPLSIREIASITRQVCAALQAAHEKGIVHRDVKPANIYLTPGGGVKVLDFGLAKRAGELASPESRSNGPPHNPTLSATRPLIGTLAYVSPEQAVGGHVDARSDIFSLGMVMYEMATGRVAFRGKTPAGILGSILTEDPARPSAVSAGVPAKLEGVILKALEKDPARRYSSAAELSADLDQWLKPSRVRRATQMAVGVAVFAILAAAVAGSRFGWFAVGSRTDLVPRQITANPPEDPVMQAALSPDGKTVAYEDFAGIHLRRIDTGETRLIPPPPDYCFR
jgi:eukaryotic-like serine/threonine-protein kinase